MNWFIFSIITLLCWSGSDFFSKIGCRDSKDKYSHLKMVVAVGAVMGLHACYEVFINGVTINWHVMLTYLPVSLLYILSMALGYIGLRYIELSISSPICNASGALVAIISLIAGTAIMDSAWQYVAVGLTCVGVVALGVIEATEDDQLRAARQEASNYKYAKSWLALALPLAYCLLDAAGTFSDTLVLNTLHLDFLSTEIDPEFMHLFTNGIPEFLLDAEVAVPGDFLASYSADIVEMLREGVTAASDAASNSANVAYELTFTFSGLVCLIYLIPIKKQKFVAKQEGPKYVGAIFETVGQFTYIFAMADESHVAMSAPIISAYCAASVLWSRIFLKEKLSWKHYCAILVIFIAIVIMGILDM